jgi:hypothetical protein
MLIKNNTGGSRPARRLTFFNAKKVSKKACSCGGHFLRMDLWCLMTILHGSLYAAVNAAAYFNGHDVLVDDYEF